MATHSSILAWEIPWTEEEPGRLQSVWSPKIRHNLVTKQQQRNSRYIRAKLTKTIKKKMKTERSDTFKKKIKNEITADFSSKRNITYCIVWGTQCSVVAKGIYVHMLLNHFAVEQKLTQHCKSAIFQ